MLSVQYRFIYRNLCKFSVEMGTRLIGEEKEGRIFDISKQELNELKMTNCGNEELRTRNSSGLNKVNAIRGS